MTAAAKEERRARRAAKDEGRGKPIRIGKQRRSVQAMSTPIDRT